MIRSIVFASLVCLTAKPVRAEAACQVVLKHKVAACPAVTTQPSDCEGMGTFGRTGERMSSGVLHVMASGYTYFCQSHGSCVEKKDLTFQGCQFDKVPGGESPEYLESFNVR